MRDAELLCGNGEPAAQILVGPVLSSEGQLEDFIDVLVGRQALGLFRHRLHCIAHGLVPEGNRARRAKIAGCGSGSSALG